MSSLETIAPRPDRILVKTFRPVSLPGFRISQSKFIKDKGQLYCVIGQKTFHSPLYTHFVVIDSYGQVVDDVLGKKIYEKVSRLNVIQYIQKKGIDFADTIKIPNQIENIERKLSINIVNLLKEGDQVFERFTAVEKEAQKLFNRQEWNLNDFSSFDQRWRRFWSSYEDRLEKLFLFREQMIKKGLMSELQDNSLKNLFHEANEMYQLFVDMVPLNNSIVTSINHLIILNYELGLTKTSRTKQYVVTGTDMSIYYFVKFGFIISLVLVFWTLIRAITKTGSFFTLLGMVILMMFFLSVRVGNEVGMLRLVEKNLKKLRNNHLSSTTIIDRHYQKQFSQSQQRNQSLLPTYTFKGTLVKIPRWLIGIGIGLMIVGILLPRIEMGEQFVMNGYLISGLIMIVSGFFLPYLPISQRNIQLEDHYIHIGKRSFTREDIIHIRTYEKANRIKVKLRTHPDPITYRIDRTKGKEINEQLKAWCDIHFVNYK